MRSILSRCVIAPALLGLLVQPVGAQQLVPAVDLRLVPAIVFEQWPADFNRDGITDLAGATLVSGRWVVGVVLGNGDGTFQEPLVSTHDNNDGRADLVSAPSPTFTDDNFEVRLSPGNGDFTFAAEIVVQTHVVRLSQTSGSMGPAPILTATFSSSRGPAMAASSGSITARPDATKQCDTGHITSPLRCPTARAGSHRTMW